MNRLARDGTAQPISRDQILRHERGQRNIHIPCSADHEKDCQPSYPVGYILLCVLRPYIHTYIDRLMYASHCPLSILIYIFLVQWVCACVCVCVCVFVCACVFIKLYICYGLCPLSWKHTHPHNLNEGMLTYISRNRVDGSPHSIAISSPPLNLSIWS